MKRLLSLGMSLVTAAVLVTSANASPYAGKKVLFIDSYHSGYPWSDGITTGVQRTLADTGVDLKVIHMDTKRNGEDAFKKEAALKAKAVIEQFDPDVVIAADDNASKYLIQPYYKDASLPFIFCGVNWDAATYGYPYQNVTGMVEVAGAKELVEMLGQFANGKRVALLADDTLSSKKDADNYKSKLGIDVTPVLVNSLDEWKQKYKEIQGAYDIMLLGNVVGIKDFNAQDAEAFALKHARIPSGAVQMGPMPYAVLGYLKVPEEQGDWAAQAALKTLAGTAPIDIPIVKNTQGALIVNARIASTAGIELPFDVIQSAEQVIE